ncbi:restriction endonuclease subunit S [Streptomyces griseoluteus]|uniref:restriction endonuclease subunit S n=1 Tax=Streptomyces griseoluteus TaxID=29306 RepID=UPI0037F607E7
MRDVIEFSTLVEINPHTVVTGRSVPFIGMEDVSEDGRLLNIRRRSVSDLSSGLSAFRNDDILFAKITPCMENGKGAHVVGLKSDAGLGSTEFHVLRPRRDVVPRYVFHWTQSKRFRQAAEAMMTGSAGQRRVPVEFFHRYTIPQFDSAEQRRIVEILDAIDTRLARAREVLLKVERTLEGLMSSLADPRPEYAPKSWRVGPLGSFIQLQRGFDITVAEQREGDVPVVSSSGITSYHDTSIVAGPGVVTGRKGKLGRVFYLDGPFWPHDTSLWVKRFGGNEPKFVALLLSMLRLERWDAATSVPTLNRNSVHPVMVAIPDPVEQRRIVNAVESMERRIRSERMELSRVEALRTGLIEDLLTGRVPV